MTFTQNTAEVVNEGNQKIEVSMIEYGCGVDVQKFSLNSRLPDWTFLIRMKLEELSIFKVMIFAFTAKKHGGKKIQIEKKYFDILPPISALTKYFSRLNFVLFGLEYFNLNYFNFQILQSPLYSSAMTK